MLSVNSYTKEYVDASRARIALQLAAYDALVAAARTGAAGEAAVAAFEPQFFANMVLVLDNLFLHRARGLEGKDSNPLNEVRILCGSLSNNDGVMTAEKAIKMKPAQTVLKIEFGDAIAISRDDFARLSDAFFTDVESRYP